MLIHLTSRLELLESRSPKALGKRAMSSSLKLVDAEHGEEEAIWWADWRMVEKSEKRGVQKKKGGMEIDFFGPEIVFERVGGVFRYQDWCQLSRSEDFLLNDFWFGSRTLRSQDSDSEEDEIFESHCDKYLAVRKSSSFSFLSQTFFFKSFFI